MTARRQAIPLETKRSVWTMTNGHCWYCGWEFQSFTGSTSLLSEEFRVDHLVPVREGGCDEIGNLRPSCEWCNALKGANDLETFRQTLTVRYNRRKQECDRISRFEFWFELEGIEP